jgi:ferric-dicitrate binding protein FerR (iron transport regulator)
MAKTKRRRPSQRSKRRPPAQQAPPRLGAPYETAPTRTFVAPSRAAKRTRYVRAGIASGAALGLLLAIFVIAGNGGGGALKPRPVTGKVLAPTVKTRTDSSSDPLEMASGDELREGSVVETDATGLGEFTYADGSLLRVGASSNYTLTHARSQSNKRDITGKLVTGKTWHRVAPQSDKSSLYEISVLGAVGKVTGTSFAVTCEVETDCFYTVVKGKVRVTDAVKQTADLNAGDRIEIKFGRLDAVKHLTPEEIGSDPWIAQNITLDGDTAPPSTEGTTTTLFEETTTTLFGETTTSGVGGVVTTSRTGTTQRNGGATPPPPPPPSPGTTQGTTATTSPATTSPPTTAAPTTTTKVGPCKQTSTTKKPPQCP